MSAIAAHYTSAAVPDARYAAHYDPATFFSYSPPPAVNTSSLDGQFALGTGHASSGPAYVWDTHEHADQSPSAYSSSASANAYHSVAAPAPTGHSSVTASFGNSAPAEYRNIPAHRSFSSNPFSFGPSHHPNPSPSSPSSSTAVSPRCSSSSHPQSYSSGPRSYSSLAAAATTNVSNSSSSTPRLQNASWDNAALYTIDPADPVSHSPSQHAYSRSTTASVPAHPVSPPIKEEDHEAEFIIEVSVPADPVPSSMPEVPLRATHAPPKMRSMMCSFRLESFAMHDGIRSAATQPGPGGIVVGPLREQPIEFEWQAELVQPLIPQEEDAFRYGVTQSKPRAPVAYPTTLSSPSSRRAAVTESMTQSTRRARVKARAEYAAARTASPALSLEYLQVDDNDAWEDSSEYHSVADNGSGSATTTASPTFAPIMTPAQSLGWSVRYQSGVVDTVESSGGYQRQAVAQPSLSRVSQPVGRYSFGSSSALKTPSYHQPEQQAHYGYDSTGYPRSSGTAGRYSEVYASSGSTSGWYR